MEPLLLLVIGAGLLASSIWAQHISTRLDRLEKLASSILLSMDQSARLDRMQAQLDSIEEFIENQEGSR